MKMASQKLKIVQELPEKKKEYLFNKESNQIQLTVYMLALRVNLKTETMLRVELWDFGCTVTDKMTEDLVPFI